MAKIKVGDVVVITGETEGKLSPPSLVFIGHIGEVSIKSTFHRCWWIVVNNYGLEVRFHENNLTVIGSVR